MSDKTRSHSRRRSPRPVSSTRAADCPVDGIGNRPGEASGRFTFEQWRAISRERYNWDLQLQPGVEKAHQFVGEYSAWGEGDVRFLHSRAAAARVRPFDAAQGRIRLVFLLSGQARISAHARDSQSEVGQGDLFVLDTAAVKQAEWSAHSDLCLQLPERSKLDLPGTASRRPGRAVMPIDDPVLSNALKSQLRLLAARGSELDAAACERVLEALVELTVLGLRDHGAGQSEALAGHDILLAKAQLYLQTHFRRPDLSVDEVAAAVGCSRTSLYRLFSARSLTVLGYLREWRLLRCRAALATASAQVNIGQVAFQHGFLDLHAFTRLFKRRFGMTPGQVRASELRP
ncbi:helix-turn-helix domain-containing protein [Lysobacter arenosi]|uniref:Helix-turn-helix domain-containing protein n=1 Tax=Lysobacter arenosi TaxID=2795387 RepID=A0ABX7RAR2_9GAMM|nr:helix-turn-helix domain-containing protein [Lysobacter arenosi]QSX74449.1 helix-turn-helix domain-containing protein [Lysobacter arenosi]